MDRLPQELIELIISHLDPRVNTPKAADDDGTINPYAKPAKPSIALAPFATISRAWQHPTERRTFRSIRIDSDELSEFQRIFTPDRRSCLVELTFTAILPSYDSVASTRVETQEDRRANDEAYSAAIASLFGILKPWETNGLEYSAPRVSLFINHPVSRSDVQWRDRTNVRGPEGEIYEGRYYHSYIALLNMDELPQLNQISKLIMKMPSDYLGHRMVYPKVPVQLASKMPNLEDIALDMNDNERRYIDCRINSRRELAECLQQVSLPALKVAELHFFHLPPKNHYLTPPILSPSTDYDLLSSTCHSFTQGLVELSIHGVLDESLLRPLIGSGDTMWPKLEEIDIHFFGSTPSGKWYFTGSPGSPPSPIVEDVAGTLSDPPTEEAFDFDREFEIAGVQPLHIFRLSPDDEVISPLVEAFADAVGRMPKIRNATLHSTVVSKYGSELWFAIAYIGPCFNPARCKGECRRIKERQLVTDLLGWMPNALVMDKLRGMGSSFHEDEMVEESMDSFIRKHSNDTSW
jgi:hypothetical protein